MGIAMRRRAGRGRRVVGAGVASAEEVLSGVFRERYSSLVGLARLLLDDRSQAEEVVQEAFARTLEAWERLRNVDDPYPYVRRTVVNLARSGLRRRVVARRSIPERAVHVPGTESDAIASESRREIVHALRSLPRRQRECVVLRYFEESSTEETADVLGISEGSVKTHLHRALQALETMLEATR
jgi:RNA polymerase sigma-70 factor (sigma-E family)